MTSWRGAAGPGGDGRGRARRRAPPESKWLGDELPLPLSVKTPQDIGFKAAAERQYLIFNLMAGGKLAFERGDYATAVDKWDTLLRLPGLDPQVERAVPPFLDEARGKAGRAPPRRAADADATSRRRTRSRRRGTGRAARRADGHRWPARSAAAAPRARAARSSG